MALHLSKEKACYTEHIAELPVRYSGHVNIVHGSGHNSEVPAVVALIKLARTLMVAFANNFARCHRGGYRGRGTDPTVACRYNGWGLAKAVIVDCGISHD